MREEPALVEAVGTRIPNPKNRPLSGFGVPSGNMCLRLRMRPFRKSFTTSRETLMSGATSPDRIQKRRQGCGDNSWISSPKTKVARGPRAEKKMSQEEHDAMEERLKKLGYL